MFKCKNDVGRLYVKSVDVKIYGLSRESKNGNRLTLSMH